jgi:hypothetical protein
MTASRVIQRACPVCSDGFLDPSTYAYLLGLYLGDGCLSRQGINSWKLRILQDARYPLLISQCADVVAEILGEQRVRYIDRRSYVEIHASWSHWQCLFPQHGEGPKHLRRIELSAWQRCLLEGHEKQLIAGLIHSDGSFHSNRVVRQLKTGPKVYKYSRYQFANNSDEIMKIFTDALETLAIPWTSGGHKTVSIARRQDVAFMRSFVPNKA